MPAHVSAMLLLGAEPHHEWHECLPLRPNAYRVRDSSCLSLETRHKTARKISCRMVSCIPCESFPGVKEQGACQTSGGYKSCMRCTNQAGVEVESVECLKCCGELLAAPTILRNAGGTVSTRAALVSVSGSYNPRR